MTSLTPKMTAAGGAQSTRLFSKPGSRCGDALRATLDSRCDRVKTRRYTLAAQRCSSAALILNSGYGDCALQSEYALCVLISPQIPAPLHKPEFYVVEIKTKSSEH